MLLLGAPLETITLLHHAEANARMPEKRRATYTVWVAAEEGAVERTYADIDTGRGAFPYEQLGLAEGEFAVIAQAALAAGIGRRGRVGESESHLFPARELSAFAAAWLEERFG